MNWPPRNDNAPVARREVGTSHERADAGQHSRPRREFQVLRGIKRMIVAAACWGLIPINVAAWIIERRGLRDA